MKTFRHLITLMAVILTFGTVHAESHNRINRNKDPWQILQITLYNHFVDTTGFSIVTPIDAELLHEITPDLAKAYQVKEKVDLSRASSMGDVICEFMRVKYAGRSGQTYDYYKYRYSRSLIHDQYLRKYPNSPYANEMRLKGECLQQYIDWSNCYDAKDYFTVVMKYESSYCPYGGFNNIALANNSSRAWATRYVQEELSQKNHPYDNDDNVPFYESFSDDPVAILVTPNSIIGHSALCIGNLGDKASITVSFNGPSPINVVLDHGQYKWVDLKNGKYTVAVTSSNGNVWSPYGNNSVAVEDGVYMSYWCENNGKILSSSDTEALFYVDDDASEEMVLSVFQKTYGVLSELSKLDYETSKKLLIHYIQQTMDPEKQYETEMEILYYGMTEEDVDLMIDSIRSYLKELEAECFGSNNSGKLFKL